MIFGIFNKTLGTDFGETCNKIFFLSFDLQQPIPVLSLFRHFQCNYESNKIKGYSSGTSENEDDDMAKFAEQQMKK